MTNHDMYLVRRNYIMSSFHKDVFHPDCEQPDYPRRLEEAENHADIGIHWARQKDFEKIIRRIAGRARLVQVFCPKVADLTPLQSLAVVEYLIVD